MINLLDKPRARAKPQNSKSDSTDDQCTCDSPGEKITKTDRCKYKTEICKNFSETGICPYKNKCQFAHGHHELVKVEVQTKKTYRTKKCKSFWQTGSCRYGFRCQFLHYEEKEKQESEYLRIVSLMLGFSDLSGGSKLNFNIENGRKMLNQNILS